MVYPRKINMVKLADSYLTSPGVARCLEPAILFPLEMQLFFFGGRDPLPQFGPANMDGLLFDSEVYIEGKH